MSTSPTITRRQVLRSLFLSGGAVAAGPLLSACNGGRPAGPGTPAPTPTPNGGELFLPTGPLANIGALGAPDLDGVSVPEGFSVRAVARHGTPPALGSLYPWHAFPDGGACYPRENGGWIYTSNSEVPEVGGCGALVFDPDGSVVDAYSILSNTSTNCAGGSTPWGTWLSCEETDTGQTWATDPYGAVGAVVKPALGLFSHEAAVVDLANRTVYQTEDTGDGRFYRWVADPSDYSESAQRLALENGRLQVMNIDGYEDGGYAEEAAELRTLRRVSWVDVVNPELPQGEVRSALEAAGSVVPGTRFRGGEGLWFYELPEAARQTPPGGRVPTRGVVFFTTKSDNRVFAYDVENDLLELIFDNEQITPGFDDVDNLTVSPAGDIIVAEDLTQSGRGIRIMVVIPNGPAKVLVDVRQEGSEICGPAFSPDGSRLYFSSQRGPNVPGGQNLINFVAGAPGVGTGVTYELLIPEAFRAPAA